MVGFGKAGVNGYWQVSPSCSIEYHLKCIIRFGTNVNAYIYVLRLRMMLRAVLAD